MILTFSPVRQDTPLTLHRKGDVLTINGEAFDLGPLPEGGSLPAAAIASQCFAGEVTRAGGVLHVTLILPHGADAPMEARFPVPMVPDRDGPVDLPPHDGPEAEGDPA